MSVLRRTLLTLAGAGAVALGAGAVAQDSFTGAGSRGEIDCAGASAVVEGSTNEVTVTGGCTRLRIEGASNVVHVDMAKGGAIQVVGAGNEVRWTTPDGSRPRISVTGVGNRVAAAKR